MNLDENILSDILKKAPVSTRNFYSCGIDTSVYLSYYNLCPNGLYDVAVCVEKKQRIGMLFKIDRSVIAFFNKSVPEPSVLKKLLDCHWTEVKDIYILPWQDKQKVLCIADSLNLKVIDA